MKCLPDRHPMQSPALYVKPRLIRQLSLPPLILLLMLGLGYVGFVLSERSGLHTLAETGERQLELHARAVESELNRFTYLPSLLELESSVAALLHHPDNDHRQAVNDYLDGLNRRSRSRAIYLLDTEGRVLATSNWRDKDSYLGEDLSFRAYFQAAVRGLPGRFYGIGSTTGEPGYYLAHGLEEHGRVIGVAVIKVRLEALEERWQKARLEAYVSDENGIIILSSDPARRLKSTQPLSAETKERLARSLQYHWAPLSELPSEARSPVAEGVETLTLPGGPGTPAVSYLSQSRPLLETPWHLTLLTPLADLRRESIIEGVLATVAFALLAIGLIAWNERRKVLSTRLAAREALELANNQLERRIGERTADLRASNERLRGEIRERRQAEDTLHRTQDELVQAGKLAAIGQMSTSVAHELNQPLAALRTLSGNTVRFLERGALETASTNLQAMNELIDRMGRITASLRAFARRGEDRGQASLTSAIEATLQVLGPRLETKVKLQRDCPDLCLPMDPTRLEQILINLLGNALDAVQNQARPLIVIGARQDSQVSQVWVEDNGHGVEPQARQHLFEPFFTTKPGNQGLGLGLTLSASLAAAAGGRLTVDHPEGGGTVFVLNLPPATRETP
ncbi:ATP-binding protein [Pseudomonas sp. dw_358]|uniref:sensor histidine kinase n=1 Tax=Pseudomonas sp. dw_358 TaxID=2720083 RepID=UPI001BD68C5B|nr:ATP-binding protein [Pseudomonas sp. dw_358]